MLSYEEAIVARQNLIKENQSKVAEIKEQVSKDVEEKNMKHGQPRMTTSSWLFLDERNDQGIFRKQI